MAQTNYTPIILYNSGTTTNAPSASNLASGELAINYTDGKLFYKDNSSAVQVIAWKTTPTTAGGTGLTSYTAGDLPYYASGSALSKLGIGTSGYVLQSNGSAPTWVAQSTLSVGTATNATNVGTTDNTSSSSTYYPTLVSATSGNNPITTSSTKLSFVPSTGTLTATSHAGAWAGSTIGTTYGGTGLTSFIANGVVYASSTSALATSSALTFDGTNFSTTGYVTATSFRPSSSSVPTNGLYLPATNTLAFATNGAEVMRMFSSGGVSIGNTTDLGSGNLGVNTQLFVNTTTSPSNTKSGNSYSSLGQIVNESINGISVGTSAVQVTKNGGFGGMAFITANQGGSNYNAVVIWSANGTVTVVSSNGTLGYSQVVSYSLGGPYNGQLFMSVSGISGGNLTVNGIAFTTNRA